MSRGYVVVCLVLLEALAACSGKTRPFSDGLAGSGSTEVGALMPDATAPSEGAGALALGGEPTTAPTLVTGAPSTAPPPRSPGAPCVTSAECDAPAQCVDGVCCSSACSELCAACNVPGSVGTCSAAPSDAACGELQCAGVDTECRRRDTTQLPLNCEAFGICKVNADCAVIPKPNGTACQSGTGTCDGAGACNVPGKVSLGQNCEADVDCAEGHCVGSGDGGPRICCDAACDSPCQACSAAGHCEETPTVDIRCEAVACPADDVCRDYTADATVSQCRGFGQCQTGRDCARIALRADAECECDAATGACQLRVGAACADEGECASGICTADARGASVCCANACAEGLFCSNDGSGCVACEGDAIECQGNTQRRCNAGAVATLECRNGCTPGTGCNSVPPLGFPCDAGQCAAPNICQQDITGVDRCCSRNCAAEGKVCAENGSCVCRAGQVAAGNDCLLEAGDPCQGTQECQMGLTCTDGVCCQQSCNGSCERCEPNTGLCVAVAGGQQDNQCNNGRQCTGARGGCRLTVRQACTGNDAECISNACEPTVGNATQICCSQACTGNRPFCRSNGQACVQCETNSDCGNGCNAQTGLCNDLLAIGSTCGTSSQCASGAQCLLDQNSQTRCCERNCAGEGLLCNGSGRCVAPAPAALATVVGGAPAAFPITVVRTISNRTQLWTIRNTGGSATAPLDVRGTPEFAANGTCNRLVLQPGGTCSVTVSFAPTAPGTRSGQLIINGGRGVEVAIDIRGEARSPNGDPCTGTSSLCASGICTDWFADPDGDGFGSLETVGGFPSKSICGNGDAVNRPAPFVFVGGCRGVDVEIPYVTRSNSALANGGLDCCDRFFRCDSSGGTTVTSNNAYPGQTMGFSAPLFCGTASSGGQSRDFDCDRRQTLVPATVAQPLSCTGRSALDCVNGSGRITDPNCDTGELIYTSRGCSFSGGQCLVSGAGQQTALCL